MEEILQNLIGDSQVTTEPNEVLELDSTQLRMMPQNVIFTSLPSTSLAQILVSSTATSAGAEPIPAKPSSATRPREVPILPKGSETTVSASIADSKSSNTLLVLVPVTANSSPNPDPPVRTTYWDSRQTFGSGSITDHDYMLRTRVDAKEALEKLERRVAEVEKKTKRVQRVSAVVRRRYIKMKGYLRQLNDLREAKNLPRIELKEDVREARGPQTSDVPDASQVVEV